MARDLEGKSTVKEVFWKPSDFLFILKKLKFPRE